MTGPLATAERFGVLPVLQKRICAAWGPGPERAQMLAALRRTDLKAESGIALAEFQLGTLVDRQIGPLIAMGFAGPFIGLWAVLLILLATLIAETVATRMAIHVLREATARDLREGRDRPGQMAAAALGAGSHALAVALCWLLGPVELRLFCFAFLALAALHTALLLNPVRAVVHLREGIYLGTLLGLCLWDVAGPGGGLETRTIVQLAVAVTISFRLWCWIGLVLARDRASSEIARAAERARDEAVYANNAKGAFVASVGHELRTPLNGILGMTQTLLSGDLTAEQRRRLEVVAESGRTLTALLNDLLDLSKMEAGQLDIAPAAESLHAGIEHVANLYAESAREKGLAFTWRIAPDVPDRLVHDGVRVRQCLSNLVANAIKFTDRGGIEIEARLVAGPSAPDGEHEIAILVRDTGIGLSAEAQERLFRPFAQGDASIPLRYGGTGLGLDIARRLARLMGGDITCESAEGEGSTFTLTVRAAPAREPARVLAELSRRTAIPAESGKAVLVVDDVETNRLVARLFLEPLGVRVREAGTVEEAVDILRTGTVDAVLLDLHLPGASGRALAAEIRSGRAGDPSVPLVAMTADHRAELATLRAQGFDGLVTKPMDQRGLQTALSAALAARAVSPDRPAPGALTGEALSAAPIDKARGA